MGARPKWLFGEGERVFVVFAERGEGAGRGRDDCSATNTILLVYDTTRLLFPKVVRKRFNAWLDQYC